MSKKKITIAPAMNPFGIDKSKSPAENIFAPQENPEKNVHNEHNVHDVQSVHTVHSVQSEHDVQFSTKTTAEKSEQKKHIHLVLPQERYEMLEQMASLQHLTVTKCLNLLIEEQYNEKWKPYCEQLEQIQQKLAKKSPKDGALKF